jgi:hypothetical protein
MWCEWTDIMDVRGWRHEQSHNWITNCLRNGLEATRCGGRWPRVSFVLKPLRHVLRKYMTHSLKTSYGVVVSFVRAHEVVAEELASMLQHVHFEALVPEQNFQVGR